MPLRIIRKKVAFKPDASRVIAYFFFADRERGTQVIGQILALTDRQQRELLSDVLRKYTKRHRNILKIFERHFHKLLDNIDPSSHPFTHLAFFQKILIGSYFTKEYSIESAAFFNPSVVEAPYQYGLKTDQKRLILSFRATGEGHISSIVFRSAVINQQGKLSVEPAGRLLDTPDHVQKHLYRKDSFLEKLSEMQSFENKAFDRIHAKLPSSFTYEELKRYVRETESEIDMTPECQTSLQETMWLASSHYEIDFSLDTDISERVIFPIADIEVKGIEDARFVRFVDDNGEIVYFATYTAYDGVSILPRLLRTTDFYHFTFLPIYGEIARNKGMALFPRKINGKYAMLCRIDGVNNFIAFSENVNIWRSATMIQSPKYPWEFVQIGNCGSPLETHAGWLVITHGVGPMREYVLSASLFQLEHPEQEIGRMKLPLLASNKKEREGAVPNVVYSCGAIIHLTKLIIPYAMSDYASTYAIMDLEELLSELIASHADLLSPAA
ncbi:Predicted glycosyl hydrolase, GH43/DUF377 family [Siphonobacter aquaeclarae]|uniref:Predicted glycosyl hydrolase, GH43/DUF377 family n=2 Tax=Siphonobacter aquaeclarae TaxID=563176 RepID=A0A1G9YNF8_9BACT|nr:Predicted glycosyl hydrolase, GH43/DUF377 family [Siphonobacter aquaeclarae]